MQIHRHHPVRKTTSIRRIESEGIPFASVISSKNWIVMNFVIFQVNCKFPDQIELLLCDYRELPKSYKYDRIIACGMMEAVGHEFMEEFFRCCESALAENGLLVLQFISIADEKYDEFRFCPGFIKEYIFPGGCLPSLSRVISAMAAASRLSVVHLEEIGSHYFDTLRRWRQNFLQNQSQVLALGFDEKFIRMWEYYFDYCAAGFKYCILGDYQMNLETLSCSFSLLADCIQSTRRCCGVWERSIQRCAFCLLTMSFEGKWLLFNYILRVLSHAVTVILCLLLK